MKSFLLSILLVVLAKADEDYGPLNVVGGSVPSLEPYGLQVVLNAQHNPNATRSVSFKPFLAATESGSTLSLGDVEWIWRINVSDFATPDARVWGDIVDPHVVSTTHDFNWPDSNGDLPSQLNHTDAGFCFTVVDWADSPVNLTNVYTKEDGNDTSCVPVLGQACVDAILSNGLNFQSSTCAGPKEHWSEFPECQSTLGYMGTTRQGFSTLSGSHVLFNSSSNATGAFGDGEGWFAAFSAPQNGSGSAAYYTAANQLQIAMFTAVFSLQEGSGVYSHGSELLCMRVNATQLPTRDPNGDGERYRVRATIAAQRGAYPAERQVTVLRISGDGMLCVSKCITTYGGEPTCSVSVMEFAGGLVLHETQYFAATFRAPACRAALAEPMPGGHIEKA